MPIAVSLLAEFSPRKWRGPLLGAFVAMWFVGAAAAYLVGEILHHVDPVNGWRWMLASAAVPAILIVLARLGTPESPRWLLKKGRVDEANEVLRKVFGPTVSADDMPAEVHENLRVSALIKAGYAVVIGGTQILQWIYPNELFPTEIRGSAVGLASSLSRIGAAIGTYLVPVSLAHLGTGCTMIVGAGVTFIGAVVSVMWAPETRGLTLGECAAMSPKSKVST